ncbi:SDR family NAD(P)-dependent oxidoreductase [Rhodalgimonas zhirmunskyi]|uniref:SDR family NAD(P)-dependent oxidoreductase n=1 Tax=Rhodalgimonas zhirmunskyi TaxID=2964767 RepID=A0AAJ1U6N4_9RHOB|nr:SDR family NAD(P)-dependent oxidoreductase [Rhodoalgimonas zhirmunskyi]MDQ2094004.1 SDR family NAD(P)-dependent oxidoreductase [Rhodoalgimonas zhirmunskyi]
MPTALVTGAAGFIGYHLCARLLSEGWRVVGIDALTDYYDPELKRARLALLKARPDFEIIEARIEEEGRLLSLMQTHQPELVVHLAAQAGVRHSIDAPRSYMHANLEGTFELLEAARAVPPRHMLLASTSSVYGANTKIPYAETDRADHPLSFYAATKKAMEAMAHSYAHLYDLPMTMFRFFTVYGPWGRPDMALFKFTRGILEGLPIDIYNHGQMRRDFTYIDDLIEGVIRLSSTVPGQGAVVTGDSLSSVAPFRVVNVGNGAPVQLLDFVTAIETALDQSADRNMMEMQPGDVLETWADTSLLRQLVGELPKTQLAEGVGEFVRWYRGYYGT